MNEIIQNVLSILQMDFWFTVLLILMLWYKKWWGLMMLIVKVFWNWDCEVLAVIAVIALMIDDTRPKTVQFFISPHNQNDLNQDIPIDLTKKGG